ncbi:MAG: hypothetical protein PWP08_205 [Methanofollis sp.]|nr:hypothetical protein [Methanofollis sp.]
MLIITLALFCFVSVSSAGMEYTVEEILPSEGRLPGPVISGDHILVEGYFDGNNNITDAGAALVLYTIDTGETRAVAAWVEMNSDGIGEGNVTLYAISRGRSTVIEERTTVLSGPPVSGDSVVWVTQGGMGTTSTALSNVSGGSLSMDRGRPVWLERSEGRDTTAIMMAVPEPTATTGTPETTPTQSSGFEGMGVLAALAGASSRGFAVSSVLFEHLLDLHPPPEGRLVPFLLPERLLHAPDGVPDLRAGLNVDQNQFTHRYHLRRCMKLCPAAYEGFYLTVGGCNPGIREIPGIVSFGSFPLRANLYTAVPSNPREFRLTP